MTSVANTIRKTSNIADVIILGAGIAGLQCAYDVKAANSCKVLVLEARDRIGGRIYTTKGYEPKNNVIEHGAQFIHGSIFVFTT